MSENLNWVDMKLGVDVNEYTAEVARIRLGADSTITEHVLTIATPDGDGVAITGTPSELRAFARDVVRMTELMP